MILVISDNEIALKQQLEGQHRRDARPVIHASTVVDTKIDLALRAIVGLVSYTTSCISGLVSYTTSYTTALTLFKTAQHEHITFTKPSTNTFALTTPAYHSTALSDQGSCIEEFI